MDTKGAIVLYILFIWAAFVCARPPRTVVNVMEYGASADGKTDDSEAFLKAWHKACTSPNPSSVMVPAEKSFLLNPVAFQGPCKSASIRVQILGHVMAPNNYSTWKGPPSGSWIKFDRIKGLQLTGTGLIDGQGSSWWECRHTNKCSEAPTAVYINNCTGFHMNKLTHINSPEMHVVIDHCTGVQISNVTVTAPGYSPNTDGIHLQNSKHIKISNSIIGTGDDCISIGTNTANVNITQISCGPGHGISVGSLGDFGPAAVENINVSNCTLCDTMNGVRIKTWQGGSGYCRGITFSDILIDSSENPIIIDQYYCGSDHNCTNATTAVEVSDVSYTDIRGTSSVETAIKLACSKTFGCANIRVKNVQLTSIDARERVTSYCLNANGTSTDVYPTVPCLARQNYSPDAIMQNKLP